jgi:hypothetical protein
MDFDAWHGNPVPDSEDGGEDDEPGEGETPKKSLWLRP